MDVATDKITSGLLSGEGKDVVVLDVSYGQFFKSRQIRCLTILNPHKKTQYHIFKRAWQFWFLATQYHILSLMKVVKGHEGVVRRKSKIQTLETNIPLLSLTFTYQKNILSLVCLAYLLIKTLVRLFRRI